MKVTHQSQARLPTRHGDFTLHIFSDAEGLEHMALTSGTPRDGCLVRLHSECATGDILGSLRCDCVWQLEEAMRRIAAAGEGLLLYLRGHEGRGIGLANKIKAYALQDRGLDTVQANLELGFPADERDYGAALAMLDHFRLRRLRLLTNNNDKIAALARAGIAVEARVPLWIADNPHNQTYLATKRGRMGHLPEEN